jgi:hypothetical protein
MGVVNQDGEEGSGDEIADPFNPIMFKTMRL